tara:strand:+ start:784 stop:1425 length:642 start_codon:yes stop_codon:yes gene_type:complete
MTSVIIRNRTGEHFIGFAIQSVLDHIPGAEIVIVDNNSADETMEVVSQFNFADIEVIDCLDYSPGRAINLGVQKAAGDVALVLSAHSQITNYNDENVRFHLQHNKFRAVFGKQIPIYRGKRITPRYIWSHFGDAQQENMFSVQENRQFLHNAFCAYDRKYLLENPFDETLAGKEDRYWAIDQVCNGEKYFYDPSQMTCNHYWTPGGATWKGMG